NTCDVLEEAHFATLLARIDPGADSNMRPGSPHVDAGQALFAATLGGARALGLGDQIGVLADGMQADIVVVGLDGAHQQPVRNPTDALIFSSSGCDVRLTMVAGREIYQNDRVVTVDEPSLTKQMEVLSSGMNSASKA